MSNPPENSRSEAIDVLKLACIPLGIAALMACVPAYNWLSIRWDSFDDALDEQAWKFIRLLFPYSDPSDWSDLRDLPGAQEYRLELLQFETSSILQKLDALIEEYEVKYLQNPSDPNYAEYQAEYREYLQYRDELKKGLSDLETLRSAGKVTPGEEKKITERIISSINGVSSIRW